MTKLAHAVALVPMPTRDRVVLRVDDTVYVWPLPPRGVVLRAVRRLRIDRPGRRMNDLPTFGGGADELPASRQLQADRLRRLHARAALFATRETLCSTQDIADVFGVREGDVRAARPATARQIGRAWMAPFGDWLAALHIDLDALADRNDAVRAPRVREITMPALRPLGGPTAVRGSR